MSILDRINEDIKKAMLAKEKEKLEALRAVKAAFYLLKRGWSKRRVSLRKRITNYSKHKAKR